VSRDADDVARRQGLEPEDVARQQGLDAEPDVGTEPDVVAAPGRRRAARSFWSRSGRRIGIGVAGFGLVAAGIILALPLVPGPGTLLIIAGLAVLATEFEWAERWLHRARQRFDAAARSAGLNPRAAGWIVVAVFVVGAAVAAGLWLAFR
jgi:uncharacterized protein (TIGR02611 family)